MKCQRCFNEDPRYFYEYQGRCYCRKCISYGKSQKIIPVYTSSNVNYHLQYALTPLQKDISLQLVKRYQNHQNTILKAVCGAGKTEMTYEVIKYALNQGHCVCFTTPRKELIIDFAKRLKSHFINIHPVIVYGGHSEITQGQFVICTTHQLYRYRHYFDLLILDEYDAFPYYQNEVLENMLLTSIKGNYIFMSATLKKGDINILSRYHQQKIPVPKCIVTADLIMIWLMLVKAKRYQKLHLPVLIFVPTIEQTQKVARYLRLFHIRCAITTSKSQHIQQAMKQLRESSLDALVTTTVLERGMTIPNVQVMVYHGEHMVYSKETLIQIAGRAGRVQPYVYGEITIYTVRKTKEITQCIEQIQQDNVLSAIKN